MAGALEGIRVVDLSAVVSGPMATTVLADQGADVVTIEQVGKPDAMRSAGPQHEGISAGWAVLNRNKRAIALNLDDEAGRAVLWDLLRTADVMVQNFRPGAIERMGFGYDEVRAVTPDIVYVSITGFGPDGPYATKRVYDPVIQAVTGFTDIQGDPDGEPRLFKTIACDKVSAVYVAQAVTAALFARERGAGGQHIEVAMMDAALGWMWPEAFYNYSFVDHPGQMPEFASFYRIWPAADGHLAMIVIQDAEFEGLCRALEREDLLTDERFSNLLARLINAHALTEVVDAELRRWPVDEIVARLDAHDVPVAKVNRRADVLADPQVVHRGSITEVEHPVGVKVRQPLPAARFSRTPSGLHRHAPRYGEHTDEVLAELGRSTEEIAALRASGVVA
jgi:crotonobetainyl-CoA:carnitine CoA-transferase CaiB-like acyl-CoA transferase